MTPLRFHLCIAAFCITLVGCGTSSGPPANIVFILIDDLGWADLPAYGNAFHETPHIDQLAREGIRFTNAYAAAPVCSPTRASIQSGQYPARVGVTDFITGHWRPYEAVTVPRNRTQHLPLAVKTMAESLREAGYATGYFGKWHLENLYEAGFEPEYQGYDTVVRSRGGHFNLENRLFPPQDVDPEDYLADVLTDKSLAFMQENRDQPFFLMLSHYAVHIPLQAKQALIEKYEQKSPPASGGNGINHPVYAAMIEHVDQSVGRIMQGLQDLGLDDNTLVVFFSDNGGLRERFDRADGVVVTSNAPLRDEKGTLYEGGIRVPLIVRLPGKVPAGAVSESIMTSVDLYPTFLDVAGVAPGPGLLLDGESLLPVLKGEQVLQDRSIFFHYPHYHHARPAGAIRSGDLKLIEFYDNGAVELYNLAEDIGEANDLSSARPDDVAVLRTRLETWRVSIGAEMPVENPDFDPSRRLEWGRHPDRR